MSVPAEGSLSRGISVLGRLPRGVSARMTGVKRLPSLKFLCGQYKNQEHRAYLFTGCITVLLKYLEYLHAACVPRLSRAYHVRPSGIQTVEPWVVHSQRYARA